MNKRERKKKGFIIGMGDGSFLGGHSQWYIKRLKFDAYLASVGIQSEQLESDSD